MRANYCREYSRKERESPVLHVHRLEVREVTNNDSTSRKSAMYLYLACAKLVTTDDGNLKFVQSR